MREKNVIQELGFFMATSPENINQKIIISQNITMNESNTVINSRKIFTLNTFDGEQVFRTQDPQLFVNKNGTIFKRIARL